jgi:hypothetical protein
MRTCSSAAKPLNHEYVFSGRAAQALACICENWNILQTLWAQIPIDPGSAPRQHVGRHRMLFRRRGSFIGHTYHRSSKDWHPARHLRCRQAARHDSTRAACTPANFRSSRRRTGKSTGKSKWKAGAEIKRRISDSLLGPAAFFTELARFQVGEQARLGVVGAEWKVEVLGAEWTECFHMGCMEYTTNQCSSNFDNASPYVNAWPCKTPSDAISMAWSRDFERWSRCLHPIQHYNVGETSHDDQRGGGEGITCLQRCVPGGTPAQAGKVQNARRLNEWSLWWIFELELGHAAISLC